MGDQEYTKRELILIGMLKYLWREASHNWISPADVQRVVTVAERLLRRHNRKLKVTEIGKDSKRPPGSISFSYGGETVVLNTRAIAAICISLEPADNDDDGFVYVMSVVSGSTGENLFSGEFESITEAITLRDKIMGKCELQGWFKFNDQSSEGETVLDRWQVSEVEAWHDDWDDEYPYMVAFMISGSPDPLCGAAFKTEEEWVALQKSFSDCLKVH